MTHFETIDLVCVECGDAFGTARLSGDEEAITPTDSGGVSGGGGLAVGSWEYAGLIEPVCPSCSTEVDDA